MTAFKKKRTRLTQVFRCVARCDEGYFIEDDKCRVCSTTCKTCVAAEKCETCHGAKLLIDFDHYSHQDHGTCVDSCPEGLEADCKLATYSSSTAKV